MNAVETGYIKTELRGIDAWRDEDGGWTWNDSWVIEDGIYILESELTPRKILRYLRQWGYLTESSKGRVQVVNDGDIIEILDKNTGEPLLALFIVK